MPMPAGGSALLVAGLDVQIIAMDDASPLRHLTLDPSVDDQRMP